MTFSFLTLFWTFFKIGLFTFDGGYAMIPLIEQEVVKLGLIGESELYQFIGISESTPGPFAINIATFIGFNTYNGSGYKFLGALVATLGVVLPSFIIISIIAVIGDRLIYNYTVRRILDIFRPAIIGFILAAGLNVVFGAILGDFHNFDFSWQALVIFIIVSGLGIWFKKIPPILLILLSGFLGLGLYLI